MAPTTLDHLLDSYILGATDRAKTVFCAGKCLSYIKFAGEDVAAQGDCKDSALESLRDKIRTRVYRAMRANHSLPIIAGIDITPGS